jgi:hypothetical protein
MKLQERLRFELSRIADEECYDGGSHQLMFLRQSEARELRSALDAQEARIKMLEAILKAVDGMIAHQYTGSREAMSYLQDVCDRAREALK